MKFFFVLVACICMFGIVSPIRADARRAGAPPALSNIRVVTPNASTYERFEIQFQVKTTAAELYMPFDAKPPAGIEPGVGVSVDGLFTHDDWKTTIAQPAFLYQHYAYEFLNNQDHFLPDAAPRWTVRFAPQTAGAWQFRLRVTDKNGTTESEPQTFWVDSADGARYQGLRETPYSQNGFLRVSKTDARYFEFEDGTPFHAQGYNSAFFTLPGAESYLQAWQANGINFSRLWMSSAGINGAAWSSWTAPGQGTKVPFDTDVTAPGSKFSIGLNNNRRCAYTDFNQEDVPVEPDTKYHVWARVKLENVDPWDDISGGLAIRAAGFAPNCTVVQGIDSDAPVLNGTTDGWVTVEGDLMTDKQQNWLPHLWLILDKAQGKIWIDEVRFYRADDPDKINLLREPRADSVYEFDPMNSFKWDQFVEAAEQSGTYLKLVVDEKSEFIRNNLAPNGEITDKPSEYNFYAAPRTPVRWLDEAWWRYLIARWGYSTAIHSFEFVNEGDPFSMAHYDAANAMAKYFHEHDPSRHMVTTSFWHTYPGAEFWNNTQYPDVDYADLHAYILTGWGDNAGFVPPKNLETRPTYLRSAPNSLHIPLNTAFEQLLTPRGVSLREPGTWTVQYWLKGKNAASNCDAKHTNARVWWILDDGARADDPELVGQGIKVDKECAAPAGTFDWQQITLPIVIGKNDPAREFRLFVSNTRGTGGDIWIDDLELVTPSGKVVPIIGSFDSTSFTSDTAWYTAAYSALWGANSPVAAKMPLIRAEGGINSQKSPNGLMELNQDRQGVWLHNFLWGQMNPGGMYDMLWWASETLQDNPKTGRSGDLYWQYKTLQDFMWDVPINNGDYRDAAAETSDPNLRAWGQRDDENGRAHLWIQNRLHTWDRVVSGESIPALSGIIALRGMKAGSWRVEWWDTWNAGAVQKSQTLKTKDGTLTLELPQPLTTDIAVKLFWAGD